MLYGLWENCYMDFHAISKQAFANIIFYIWSGDNFINQCYRIRDVTVFENCDRHFMLNPPPLSIQFDYCFPPKD